MSVFFSFEEHQLCSSPRTDDCRIHAHDFASANNDLVHDSCVLCCSKPKQSIFSLLKRRKKSPHLWYCWLPSPLPAVSMIFYLVLHNIPSFLPFFLGFSSIWHSQILQTGIQESAAFPAGILRFYVGSKFCFPGLSQQCNESKWHRLFLVKKDLLGEVKMRITSALLSYSEQTDEQKTLASLWKYRVWKGTAEVWKTAGSKTGIMDHL